MPHNFNKDFRQSQDSNKGTTSVTGNGYYKEIPHSNGLGLKSPFQANDDSDDVIFRGLLNVHPSDMHHDQPEMNRLCEKRLSELSVISEDLQSSFVKNTNNYDDA